MAQIISSSNFNPASLNADDLYIAVVPPPSYLTGVPSGVAAVIGGASWGPLNSPMLLGSPNDLNRTFGGISAAALTDEYDLATDVTLAFMQSQSQASLQIAGIRVSDGTDVKASVILKDTTATTPKDVVKLTAKYSGVLGNYITVTVKAGAKSGTFDVIIQPFVSGPGEQFIGIAGSGSVFWDNLISAINNGQSGVRGPSQFLTAAYISPAPTGEITPAVGTFTLTSGTDGRSGITASTLLGSNSAAPFAGAYSLVGFKPTPSVFWLAGNTDDTVWSQLQALADSIGSCVIASLPAATDTAVAISTKQSTGVDDPNFILAKDFVYFFDSVNNVVRFVPPTAVMGGRIATLSPEQSPSNKPVYGIIGTERNSPTNGNVPYSNSEVGQLESNGILFISNPVPGGNYFGFRHGNSTSSNPVTAPIEYGRMTNFLALSFASTMGKFIGQLQSIRVNDPLRAAVRTAFNSFLIGIKDQIDGFLVQCDLSNNTPATIAAHYLYTYIKVRYLSSVKFFVVSLQGGTTVVTVGNSASEVTP